MYTFWADFSLPGNWFNLIRPASRGPVDVLDRLYRYHRTLPYCVFLLPLQGPVRRVFSLLRKTIYLFMNPKTKTHRTCYHLSVLCSPKDFPWGWESETNTLLVAYGKPEKQQPYTSFLETSTKVPAPCTARVCLCPYGKAVTWRFRSVPPQITEVKQKYLLTIGDFGSLSLLAVIIQFSLTVAKHIGLHILMRPHNG